MRIHLNDSHHLRHHHVASPQHTLTSQCSWQRHPWRRYALAVVAVLVMAAALAACSNDSDANTDTTDDDAAVTATATIVSPTVQATAATPPSDATPTGTEPLPTSTVPSASPSPSPTSSTQATAMPTQTMVAATPTIPIATYGNHEIYVINADGTNERRLTNAITVEMMPMWSPDGARLAYSRSDQNGYGGGVYAMRPDGTTVEELLPPSTYGYQELSWLPNNRIAFMTCEGSDCGVFTADIGGANRERLPAPVGGYEEIAWSPDGTRIAYVNSHSGNQDLFVMTVADGSVQQLTSTPTGEWSPAWSPDGRSIAYMREDADWAGAALYVIDATGVEPEPRLIHHSTDIPQRPAWSPDGSALVFMLGTNDHTDLWVVNVDGSNLRQLTSAPDYDMDPVWSPDGSQIAFISTRDGGQPIDCSFGTMASMRAPIPMESHAWEVHAIVVGTVVEALPPVFSAPLNPEVNETPHIVSDYLLDVEQQYRGHLREETIRLRVAGGKIGDCEQTHSPSVKLAVGDRLLIFLYTWEGDPTLPEAFIPSLQGVWAVTERDTIVTSDHAMNPPGYDGMSLDEVRTLIVESLSGEPPNDAWDPVPLEEAPITQQSNSP